jgi:hypothetical protein
MAVLFAPFTVCPVPKAVLLVPFAELNEPTTVDAALLATVLAPTATLAAPTAFAGFAPLPSPPPMATP